MVFVPASGVSSGQSSVGGGSSAGGYPGLRTIKLDEFQAARFGNAVIFQEEAERSFGHRIAVHEIPGRDEPVVQILGRKPREWSLSGLVLSLKEAKYLEQACEIGQIDTLYMPDNQNFEVRIETCATSYSASQRGVFNVSLTFKEKEKEEDNVIHAYTPKPSAVNKWRTLHGILYGTNAPFISYSPVWYRDDIALVAADWGSLFDVKYAISLSEAARISPTELIRELLLMTQETARHFPSHYFFRAIRNWDPNKSVVLPNYRLNNKVVSNRAAFVYIATVLAISAASLRMLNDIEILTSLEDVNSFISNLSFIVNHITTKSIEDSENLQEYQSLVNEAVTDTLYYLRDVKAELPKLTSYQSDGFNPALYLSYRLYGSPSRASEITALNSDVLGRSLPSDVRGFKV